MLNGGRIDATDLLLRLDCNRVIPGLYQGAYPEPDGRKIPFVDVIVLAARELQPSADYFPQTLVIHAPIDDNVTRRLVGKDAATAVAAGQLVARMVARGQKVLVTCAMGLNRSGLISSIALVHLDRTPHEAIRAVRRARPGALYNQRFVEFLISYRP